MEDITAKVNAWVKKTDARMLAVFKESTQRFVDKAQRRIPVDTGFARASIRASTEQMPQIDKSASKPNTGSNSVPYDPFPVTLVINSLKPGQRIYIGWTANYVEQLERGHSNQAPSGFIRVTALEWPQIVKDVTAEAKARAHG